MAEKLNGSKPDWEKRLDNETIGPRSGIIFKYKELDQTVHEYQGLVKNNKITDKKRVEYAKKLFEILSEIEKHRKVRKEEEYPEDGSVFEEYLSGKGDNENTEICAHSVIRTAAGIYSVLKKEHRFLSKEDIERIKKMEEDEGYNRHLFSGDRRGNL